eukprot:1073927-Pyramimonas_sp.AAC.1
MIECALCLLSMHYTCGCQVRGELLDTGGLPPPPLPREEWLPAEFSTLARPRRTIRRRCSGETSAL